MDIRAVGGYNEVGKNCTAVRTGNDAVVFDLGLHLENYIRHTESEHIVSMDPETLMDAEAVPDISLLEDWRPHLRALMPTHAHLDHIGALPFMANELKAPVIATPFTTEVLRAITRDEKIRLHSGITPVLPNSTVKVTKDVKAEFIHVTHSTPHTAMIALHTSEGVVLYANDFKLDDHPTLGRKPNYKRLKELGDQGVKCLIADSTYAPVPQKTPSEMVAREMLREVLLEHDAKGKALVVTTFSSHIARLKSIIECGKKLNRKIVFMGRSLYRYVSAAERAGLVNFTKDVELVRFGSQIRRKLKRIEKEKHKYLLVMTGHQGEPQATLSKIARGDLKFRFDPGDHVVFSCKTIPTPTNRENREKLENDLRSQHVRLFLDVHQSGHAAREDLRDFLGMVKPEHLVPAHGGLEMRGAFAELAQEMGWDKKNIHLLSDGEQFSL